VYENDDMQDQFCIVIKDWLDAVPEADKILEHDREQHEREMIEMKEKINKYRDSIIQLMNALN